MSKSKGLNRWLVPGGVVMVLCAITAGYLYQAVWGGKGYLALLERSDEARRLEATLADVRTRREHLDIRIRGLREDTLDLDLLDERAREVLGYARPDELILIVQDPPR